RRPGPLVVGVSDQGPTAGASLHVNRHARLRKPCDALRHESDTPFTRLRFLRNRDCHHVRRSLDQDWLPLREYHAKGAPHIELWLDLQTSPEELGEPATDGEPETRSLFLPGPELHE